MKSPKALYFLVCFNLFVILLGESQAQEKAPTKTLMEARQGHKTKLIDSAYERSGPAKFPPPKIFELIQYPSTVGKLSAYLSPDPKDKVKRPLVIWMGDSFDGLKKALWEEETAALRDSGLLLCCPSFRGENENPGQFELAYGEVTDLVALVDHLGKLSYVDSKRIYVVGYGRGGTLALLAALATNKLRAAFSLCGYVSMNALLKDGKGYGNTPFDLKSEKEKRLRSASAFIETLKTPSYYFGLSGSKSVGGVKDMGKRALAAKAPLSISIVNHDSEAEFIPPMLDLVISKIEKDKGKTCQIEVKPAELEMAMKQHMAALEKQEAAIREAGDLRTLARLKEALADFSKPHKLDHYFLGRDKAKMEKAVAAAAAQWKKSSKLEEEQDDKGKSYYYFSVSTTFPLSLENVFSASKACAAFAKKWGLQYDGWGTKPIP